jgi:hypothetical protein
LDVISGDVQHQSMVKQDLVSIWEKYQTSITPATQLEDYSYDSLSIVEGSSIRHASKRTSKGKYHGTILEFGVCFVVTLLLNVVGAFVIFTLSNISNQMRFGGIF